MRQSTKANLDLIFLYLDAKTNLRNFMSSMRMMKGKENIGDWEWGVSVDMLFLFLEN